MGGLAYATRDEDGWSYEHVDVSVDEHHVRHAIDSSGRPHIVTVDRSSGEVRYARREDGEWLVTRVGDSFSWGASPDWKSRLADVAVAGDDRVVIAYIRTDDRVAFWSPAP